MTRWRIELWDAHGEREVGTLIVKAPSLAKAKQHAAGVYRRRLSGSGDVHLEARGHRTYCIILGEDEIGQARITYLAPHHPVVPDALWAQEQDHCRARGAVGRSSCGLGRGAHAACLPHGYRKEMIQ